MMIDPTIVPVKTGTIYPFPFNQRVVGRSKQRLGDAAGLKNFGVNLVVLQPGSQSALRHWHQRQDEFIYVLSGEVWLITETEITLLMPGIAAGFPAGEANGHHLVNRSQLPATYLEIGDRTPADRVSYPDDDLQAVEQAGGWQFLHKDGTPYVEQLP